MRWRLPPGCSWKLASAGVEISVRGGTERHTQPAWTEVEVEELWQRWLDDGGELAGVPMPEGWTLACHEDNVFEARSAHRVYLDVRVVVVVTCAWEADDEPSTPLSARWFILVAVGLIATFLLISAIWPEVMR